MLASFKQTIPPGTFARPKTPPSRTPSRVIKLVFCTEPSAFPVRATRGTTLPGAPAPRSMQPYLQ